MRISVKGIAALLLASPLGLQAADTRLESCESTVGAWELVGQPGGRGLAAREGAKYQVIWVFWIANAITGATEGAGQAGECTCRVAASRLVWQCRVAFSLQSAEVGAEQTACAEPPRFPRARR